MICTVSPVASNLKLTGLDEAVEMRVVNIALVTLHPNLCRVIVGILGVLEERNGRCPRPAA